MPILVGRGDQNQHHLPGRARPPSVNRPRTGGPHRGTRPATSEPPPYARAVTSGSERSNANLSFASSLPASGYSPEKHASQWRSRSPRTAS